MRPVSPTTLTPLYENASGLQLTPSEGAQVLTWTNPLGTQSRVDDARSIKSTSKPPHKTSQSEPSTTGVDSV